MKPVIRYQSQLLYRKSYKPARGFSFRRLIRPVAQKVFAHGFQHPADNRKIAEYCRMG